MREVQLDGNRMQTKEEMHDHLIEQLQLPYYYARNLDSLWSILSKDDEPTKISIIHASSIEMGYGETLTEMLWDLKKTNPNYVIEVSK